MKRASVSSGKSCAVDDELKAKFKYQTLLEEYLALQKENVAKKKKLQAAKQRRKEVLHDVRFLRHRHSLLVRTSDCSTEDPDQMQNSAIQSNALESERNQGFPEAVTESLDQVLVKKASPRKDEEDGQWQNLDKELRLANEPVNSFVHDKRVGKRKISWPNQSKYGGLIQ